MSSANKNENLLLITNKLLNNYYSHVFRC